MAQSAESKSMLESYAQKLCSKVLAVVSVSILAEDARKVR
jgi:hypothetical protein